VFRTGAGGRLCCGWGVRGVAAEGGGQMCSRENGRVSFRCGCFFRVGGWVRRVAGVVAVWGGRGWATGGKVGECVVFPFHP